MGSTTFQTKGLPIDSEVVYGDFDEYGAELGRDARFWKTYVQEAERSDAELVEGWSKSLDLILIFAALFSAISTAFVIESSKKLQPDPADTSAQALLLISQLLLAASSNSQDSPPLSQTNTTMDVFTPSVSAVCVNTLWFMSLSLSVAVSLIAMLAKEWCYTFMSGRTGQACLQARKHQQRWDGLVRWRMQELLVFVPSAIHLALLLFAIGLSIYLWDIHFGVAIPVVFVTTISVIFYATSTILPLIDEFCPYGTTLSKVLKIIYAFLPSSSPQLPEDNPKQDRITSQALHWLIVNCEVPRSVDIALQAIAGADNSLPRTLLDQCDAAALISRRLTTRSSYAGSQERIVSLYARALSFLKPENHVTTTTSKEFASTDRLEISISELQSKHERETVDLLVDGKFMPTSSNLAALRIGSTKPSVFLSMLNNQLEGNLVIIDSAVMLLCQHMRQEITLHPAALSSLVKAVETLFSCALMHCESRDAVRYPMRLIQAYAYIEDWGQRVAAKSYLGVILTAFALAQHDYPGWTRPPPLAIASRAERAMEVVTFYDSQPQIISPEVTSTLMYFGSLGILSHNSIYRLTEEDLKAITSVFESLYYLSIPTIHTLPKNPESRNSESKEPELLAIAQYTMDLIPSVVWPAQITDSLVYEDIADAYIGALSRVVPESKLSQVLTEEAYIFIVETLCRNRSISRIHACFRLLSWATYPNLDSGLAKILRQRKTIQLLLETQKGPRIDMILLAISQLWLILDSYLQLDSDLPEATELLVPLLKSTEEVTNDPAIFKSNLAMRFRGIVIRQPWHPKSIPEHFYLHKVLRQMVQAEDCPDAYFPRPPI